jgi:hypothetical protein
MAPATQKTVTKQTIIGEAGIALIYKRAIEMGYLFHPRRVDHGIDGHLDLVDSRSGALLSLTILVQSKASELPFAGEDDAGFHYLCEPQDLDLWLAGNAPVVIVFSHPSKEEAWWVDVKAAFPTPQSRATRRIDVDKRAQRFDRDAAPLLLDLGLPRGQGLYLRPTPKPEALESNLLPISAMPDKIYLARSAADGDYRRAGDLLGEQRTRDVWILRDGNVMSFADLGHKSLNALTASDVELHDTMEWAQTEDVDRLWTFMDLLTRTIQGSYPELRWDKKRKHMHFLPSRDLSPRKIASGSGNRKRTVFKGHGDDGTGKPGYYSHAALRLRVRRIGGRWYAQLEPDHCFTTDGRAEHRNADLLLAGIKRLNRHPAMRGWNRTWATFLGGSDDLFSSDLPVRYGSLLTFDVNEGIDDRLWGPTPDEFESGADDTDESAPPTTGDPTLDSELLSLFDEEDDEPSDRPAARKRRPTKSSHSRSRESKPGRHDAR